MPLVSIIINNYNYGRFLRQAIESALGQTYADTEVIVVDDGSTDDSRDIIARANGRIIPVLKDNGGQASAFNAGFEASSGDVVIFLDADDLLLSAAAESAVWCVQEPGVVKAHWPMHQINGTGKKTGKLMPADPLIDGDYRDHVIQHGPVSLVQPPTSGNAWSQRFLSEIFPLDEHSDKHGADGYLRKLAPIFGCIRRIDEPQSCYRVHADNYGGGRGLMFKFRRALRRYPTYCRLLAEHLRRMNVEVDPEHWMQPGSEYAWLKDVVALHEELVGLIPEGAAFIVVGDDMLDRKFLHERVAIPFFEQEGTPRDDAHAISELERLRSEGADYIVFTFSAFWWLAHYPAFTEHVRSHFACMTDNPQIVVFDLQNSGRGQ